MNNDPIFDFLKIRLCDNFVQSKKFKINFLDKYFEFIDIQSFDEQEKLPEHFFSVFISSNQNFFDKNHPNAFRLYLSQASDEEDQKILNHKLDEIDLVLRDTVQISELIDILRPMIEIKRVDFKNRITKEAVKNLKELNGLITLLDLENRSKKDLESIFLFTQNIINFEKEIIAQHDEIKIDKLIRSFIKSNRLGLSFRLFKITDLIKENKFESIYPLPQSDDKVSFIKMRWDEGNTIDLLKVFFLYHSILKCFEVKIKKNHLFDDENLWKSAVDFIPFPLVLLTVNGEVRQYNSLFLKLKFNPQDCLRLHLNEKVIINEIPYNVFRKDIFHFDEEKILIVFFTESFFLRGQENHIPSGQELGIITSSIAHELNNPIAGIHAALSCLMLDANERSEDAQLIQEMKNGAIRCKQLIETFLGFSRVRFESKKNAENSFSNIEFCYQQAQNLLRFRSIESGVRINLTYSQHSPFKNYLNPSLLTMTFYLIFGELMTLHLRNLFITEKPNVAKNINGELIESNQEIIIQLSGIKISDLTLSKLIQNLLNIEGLDLQINDYSLRFINH